MAAPASSDNVRFGLVTETEEGVLKTGTAVPVVITTGITPEYTSNIIQDDSISGTSQTLDARTNLRGLNLQTPAKARFNDNLVLVEAGLRQAVTAAVTVTGSSDIDMLTAGTHKDGSTGPQITVNDTSSFDDLIEYGGVNSTSHPNGGAEGLLARITGFSNSKNNWHRRIKAVWKNGTDSYIDIESGWNAGTVGAFAEPVAAESGASAVITVGKTIRNRGYGAGAISKTALWQYLDMATYGKFGGGYGMVLNDIGWTWSGKEGAMVDSSWIGYGQAVLTDTDPTGSGFVDNNLYTQMLIGAEDLVFMGIVTTTRPIILTRYALTNFNLSVAGNCAAIDNVSGTSTITGVRRGKHSATGTIDYNHCNDIRGHYLAQLGAEGTSEQAEVSFMFRDRAGNELAVASLRNEFSQTGPVPGSENNTVSGQLSFTAIGKSDQARMIVYQEIAAA